MSPNLKQPPSANWLALQKVREPSFYRQRRVFKLPQEIASDPPHRREKRKSGHETVPDQRFKRGESSSSSAVPAPTRVASQLMPRLHTGMKKGESIDSLRRMILGELEDRYTGHQKQPGKYVALDCEMVGVGIDGKESSLARVSIVDYDGAVVLDEFVEQRERVVDYRTQWSGVRPGDLANAQPFKEVQKRVADLLQDKILVGHALSHDRKALMLSHPSRFTRDTQELAHKYKLSKSRHPALRTLTVQEFGIQIQEGEHSSVTDARATMAIYRLHRHKWEKERKLPLQQSEDCDRSDPSRTRKKRKRSSGEAVSEPPGGGKKGISSGPASVVNRLRPSKTKNTSSPSLASKEKADWWSELGSSKGSLRTP